MSLLNAYFPGLSYPRVASVVFFLVLWLLGETIRGDDGYRPQAHRESLGLAASDLVKSMFSLSMWFVSQQLSGLSTGAVTQASPDIHPSTCQCRGWEIPVSGPCSICREPRPRSTIATLAFGSVRLTLAVGLVYALRAYIDLRTRELVHPFTLYLGAPLTLMGTLIVLRLLSWKIFPSPFWHATALQFAGFFIVRHALFNEVPPPYSHLAAFAFCNSLWVSLVDVICGLHRNLSIHLFSTAIFAESCLVHFILSLLHPPHDISDSYYDHLASALRILPLIESARDVVALSIIRQYGAITQGILTSLASTILVVVDTWKLIAAPDSAFLGCLIAILGFGTFVSCGQFTDEQQQNLKVSVRRCYALAIISLVALGYTVIVISQNPGSNSSDLLSIRKKLSSLSKTRSDCRVPGSSGQTIANFTHFDNILLIVFFSHARYDANLDFHREVYGDYFPNVVYIGPASREDKGFTHSYDVLVDSFQSEEDLSDPLYYRMAGRMAHHMLYTALREYGCYDGYLWVPFDTLLNIPRLQQFNQSLFWYHSPWGKPVPNPAFGNLTEPTLDVSRHAPPAMISPDTSINLTETWRGWGPDWWWGDPHVGVSVCMNAFHKVPEGMRTHLARLTDGETRLIGGSADTLYIPGRHRKAFMDVLALFLETNCFLEIATPTTVHLVVPPGEPIQFVDHWWIYQPPFNASFVRQKWAEGYEVDTFHTFHWGDRSEDGIWRGDHRHVTDVRHLLRESAERQGLGDTFPVNLGAE